MSFPSLRNGCQHAKLLLFVLYYNYLHKHSSCVMASPVKVFAKAVIPFLRVFPWMGAFLWNVSLCHMFPFPRHSLLFCIHCTRRRQCHFLGHEVTQKKTFSSYIRSGCCLYWRWQSGSKLSWGDAWEVACNLLLLLRLFLGGVKVVNTWDVSFIRVFVIWMNRVCA